MPIIREIEGYKPAQTVPQILFDWVLVMATVFSLLVAISNIVRNRLPLAGALLVLFGALLWWVLYRTRKELHDEEAE